MPTHNNRINPLWHFAPIFIIAVALNYVWEIAQGPLFAATNNWGNMWWHCFVASLGDGILLWIIYAAGWTVFRRSDWFIDPGFNGYDMMPASELVIAVTTE